MLGSTDEGIGGLPSLSTHEGGRRGRFRWPRDAAPRPPLRPRRRTGVPAAKATGGERGGSPPAAIPDASAAWY